LGITFVPGHQLKKNNIPTKLISSKEVSKNHDKNSACSYLREIPFVFRIDNGPLKVKIFLNNF